MPRALQHLRRFERVATSDGVSLESEGGTGEMSEARAKESLERLEAHLAALTAGSRDPTFGDAAAEVLADARAGLERLVGDGPDASLTEAMEVAFEAVVMADGSRPSVFVQCDRVNVEEPTLGDWAASVATYGLRIAGVAQSVGRVDLTGAPDGFVGTAFAVCDGVVATNRHVLEAIAAAAPSTGGNADWQLKPGVCIDFKAEHEEPTDPRRRFGVAGVAFAGSAPIGDKVDPGKLDLALLQLESRAEDPFPPALTLATDPAGLPRRAILYVVGFPGRPVPGSEDNRVLRRLYGDTYGVKRWAPGRVAQALGEVAGDAPEPWTFAHDASTLEGSSGSCVVDLTDGETAVGIHFGGERRLENYAHALARILDRL